MEAAPAELDLVPTILRELAAAAVAAGEPADPPTMAARVLGLAVAAAQRQRTFAEPLHRMLEWLEEHLDDLTPYDAARFWHLRGISAWRRDGLVFVATRAFNRSTAMLSELTEPRDRSYLAVVHDTFGQMLHYQGRLAEARHELRRALACRDPNDAVGRAHTHGNLGRLCVDLGEYAVAARHFTEDLVLVERAGGTARRRAELHYHLGDSRLRLGWIAQAEREFLTAYQLAGAGNPSGIGFAMIGLGRAALARGRVEVARTVARAVATTELGPVSDVPGAESHVAATLVALARSLSGGCREVVGDRAGAIADYQAAIAALAAGDATPIDRAEILRGLARVLRAEHEDAVAADHLRSALSQLDASTAAAVRRDIENELHAMSDLAWVAHSAGRYIGQAQLDDVLRGGDGTQAEVKHLTVLFSDIRGFAAVVDRLPAEAVIELLNDAHTALARCIDHHGGAVDKFIGDAVMAVFPRDPTLPASAIDAALAMREEIARIDRCARDEDHGAAGALSVGIGIHAGEVVSGLIGSPQRRAVTVIGQPVNTASHMEGMTKRLGASILISEDALADVDRRRYLLRALGRYAPRQDDKGVVVYDVMGVRDRSADTRRMEAEIDRTTTAWALMDRRRFDDAARLYASLVEATGRTPRAAGYRLLAMAARDYATRPDAWAGRIGL